MTIKLFTLLCGVSLFASLLHFGADAACGSTLSTHLTRSDIDNNTSLDYLFVSSPYGVSVASGEFAIVWNGTDAGEIDSLLVSGKNASIALVDGTVSTPTSAQSPRPPRKVVSTADRSTVSQTLTVLTLVLGFGAIQYFGKGFAPVFVIMIALSTINLMTATIFSTKPCPDTTITLQIPEGTIRFICVNNDTCVCGPGFTGDNCEGTSAPVSTPISAPLPNPPVATPVAAPVAAPVNPPIAPPVTPPVTPPVAPSCSDNQKNGLETDVDCGGGTCPKCDPGNMCAIDSDCYSDVCTNSLCQQPTCSDSTQNANETDIDCGGGECPACNPGEKCLYGPLDCDSFICSNNQCTQPTCSDNTMNQDETDVDCGGVKCSKCGQNKMCNSNSDCASNLSCSSNSICIDACTDGVKNNAETDTDCGGITCTQRCAIGQKCLVGADCTTGYCAGGGTCANMPAK